MERKERESEGTKWVDGGEGKAEKCGGK